MCRRLPSRDGPPTRWRRAPGAPRAQAVQAGAAPLPAGAGQHLPRQEGSQGPLCADFAALRGFASRRAPPGPDVGRRLRRPARPAPRKTYLLQGPAHLTMAPRVGLAAMRWPIATCFQEGKQLRGLGDYEGRSWIGGHHPMTLCLLAHFFRVRQKLQLQNKAPSPDRAPMCRLRAAILPRPRSRLDHTWQILGYQGARHTAATRSHALRRRHRGHPP